MAQGDPEATLPQTQQVAHDAVGATLDLPQTEASAGAEVTVGVAALAEATALIPPRRDVAGDAQAYGPTLPVGSRMAVADDPCEATCAFTAKGDSDRTDIKPPSGAGAASGGGRVTAKPPGSPLTSRYRVMRPHARGGLGEVFVAIDEELQREVALKEIQPRHADHPESRTRFLLEAEVTGGLEHPGIVPVYGLGSYQDGRPYYAMRFIRGESLRKAVESHHTTKDAGHDPGRRELELRQLLRRFLDVCNAIHYAHCRGVLHRDLKPDNVMLGDFGETLVVDWGLAKTMDRPDPEPGRETLSLLRPMSAGGESFTLYGSAIGTPQYMSPEQAEGLLDQLGPATDIYSLGATFYHIVTGTVPFTERAIPSLLKAVKEGKFRPPREANKAVAPALEAICLKAMALRPDDRYATAHDLAADVERWLADEPVSVFREPWTTRAWRWARRHKTLVGSTAALLVTALVGLTIGTVLVKREQARTEVQRQQAETNFKHARDAVDQMLTELGEVELADVPQAEPVRKKMLGKALEFYRRFLDERRNDKSVRQGTGQAATRLGDILEMLGNYESAEAAYREAFHLLEPMAGKNPSVQADLARARHQYAILLRKSGRYRESHREVREAIRIRKDLADRLPNSSDSRKDLTDSLYHLGALMARLPGRMRDAENAYRTAVDEQRRRVAEVRDQPDSHRKLAKYLNNLGILLQKTRVSEADAVFRDALTNQEALVAASPHVAGYQWELARTRNNLAACLLVEKRFEDAEKLYVSAHQGLKQLADNYPTVPDYRSELTAVDYNLSRLRAALSRGQTGDAAAQLRDSAEADLREAIGLLRALATVYPGRPDYRQRVGLAYWRLGVFLEDFRQQSKEAEGAYREALAIQRKLVEKNSLPPEYHSNLGSTLQQYGWFLATKQHHPQEALRLLDLAEGEQKLALEGDPGHEMYQEFVANILQDKALTLLQVHDHRRAADVLERFAAVWTEKPDLILKAGREIAAGCIGALSSDTTLNDATRQALRGEYVERAMKLLKEAVKKGFRNPQELEDAAYDPLRGREDFKRLQEATKTKANPIVG
jgi:serine/threonine-protein kinase